MLEAADNLPLNFCVGVLRGNAAPQLDSATVNGSEVSSFWRPDGVRPGPFRSGSVLWRRKKNKINVRPAIASIKDLICSDTASVFFVLLSTGMQSPFV